MRVEEEIKMVGKQIKKARLLAGLSQGKLGAIIGKGVSTISEWKSGKRSPDIELIPIISEVLNVSQSFLMDLTDDPHREVYGNIPDSISTFEEDTEILRAYHAADRKTKRMVKMLLNVEEDDE